MRAERHLSVRVVVLLLGAALLAWIVLVDRMRGMDAGPGTDLGGLGWFLGIWVTMTAAMMLPSTAPMVSTYARASRGSRVWVFVAGYLAAWTAYGLAAYGFYRLVVAAGFDWLGWDRAGPYVAGAAIVAAGLYQLSPLKEVCLRHCRGPFQYIVHGWREGRLGALRMGSEHGLYCVGCCWGLMLALFALGVMSLFWTAVVAAAIFAEKVLPARATSLARLRGLARRPRALGGACSERRAGADRSGKDAADDAHGPVISTKRPHLPFRRRPMSLKLYDYAASGNCYKVRLLLAQLGRPYERIPIDIFGGDTLTPEYAEKNPARATPVLELEDGTFVTESNAILFYLARGTEFLPEERPEPGRGRPLADLRADGRDDDHGRPALPAPDRSPEGGRP